MKQTGSWGHCNDILPQRVYTLTQTSVTRTLTWPPNVGRGQGLFQCPPGKEGENVGMVHKSKLTVLS